jgi:hypothetical protein
MDDSVEVFMRECERQYEKAKRIKEGKKECSLCKTLIKAGFDIDGFSLARICIRYCGRWALTPA